MSNSVGYLMFLFEWTSDYQAYDYAFNCKTGQMVEDHGYLEGDSQDFRWVIALNSLTRQTDIIWDQLDNDDIFLKEDLVKMGKVLAEQAGFKLKNIMRQQPTRGEAVFIYAFHGGVTESSANGPGEGWMETQYVGEFTQLITKLEKQEPENEPDKPTKRGWWK